MQSRSRTRAKAGTRLAVLSYNIHHAEGVDGTFDLARIAGVINSASPDIVSLQEVDRNTARSGGVDQLQELARLTGMSAVFGRSMGLVGGEYGNAVLTRLPVRKSECIPLPGEPRSALCVTVEMTAGTLPMALLIFIATHLDTSQQPRLESPPLIEKVFASDVNAPAVVAGDFNAEPESPTMRALSGTWENATSGKGLLTYAAASPVRQIDYILYRPSRSWRVMQTAVLDEPVASDHRPIFAVLEWLPASATRTGS